MRIPLIFLTIFIVTAILIPFSVKGEDSQVKSIPSSSKPKPAPQPSKKETVKEPVEKIIFHNYKWPNSSGCYKSGSRQRAILIRNSTDSLTVYLDLKPVSGDGHEFNNKKLEPGKIFWICAEYLFNGYNLEWDGDLEKGMQLYRKVVHTGKVYDVAAIGNDRVAIVDPPDQHYFETLDKFLVTETKIEY